MSENPKPPRVFLYAKFDISALTQLAETLRHVPCRCNQNQSPRCGALNWAIFLIFENGVEWVFRSPRKPYYITPETTAELLQSEVATMKYIKQHSSVPVPDILDYCATGDNVVGVPFILMSKASGSPLSNFDWDKMPEGRDRLRKNFPFLKRPEKKIIMEQLGKITAELSQLRFDKLGSLFLENGEYEIKKCLSPSLIFHQREILEDDVPRGLFQNEHEYYEALLSAFLLHVKELPIEQHLFFAPIPKLAEYDNYIHHRRAVDQWNFFAAIGSKLDSSRNRVDYCIVGHFLQKMIPSICQQASGNSDCLSGYPLSHPDLSTSNIFIDDKFNITCIIDWALTSTVPMSTLLTTPSFPHPRDDVDLSLSPLFKSGFDNRLSERGYKNPPGELWENSHQAWLFTRLVMLDGLQDYHYFTELYSLVFKPEEEPNIPLMFGELRKEKEFSDLTEELVEYERPIEKIKRDEEASFFESDEGNQNKAIARKLTMVSLFSKSFVADRRLWKWLAEAIE